ncbi:MAG TPA: HPr family phosphocarrier protein [bacterium (Candidatus Stahlbacteria)]|nr:HPr family phosphocarrier protein [Candidatus Stahlbacteria bacterium]
MIREKIIIENEYGLHALPATQFVKTADKFKSEIKLIKDDITVNGRSIMAILTLACEKGSVVELIVEGKDEKKAMNALKKILRGKKDG